MNNLFQNWIDQRGQLPGILACAIHLPDQNYLTHSNDPAFPADQTELVLRQMIDTTRNYPLHRIPTTRLLWTFENALFHWATRQDTATLGLFTPSDPRQYDPEMIENLIQEFLTLTPS